LFYVLPAAGRQRLWNCGSTSKELLTMEYQSNVQYASCFPPRLEDAGLEDCALPFEKIQVWLVGFYL
jgi:hypothetical protein